MLLQYYPLSPPPPPPPPLILLSFYPRCNVFITPTATIDCLINHTQTKTKCHLDLQINRSKTWLLPYSHPRPRVSCPLAEITARWYRFGTPGLKRTPNGNKQRPMCHVLFCALLTAKGRLVADCSKNLDNEHVESG